MAPPKACKTAPSSANHRRTEGGVLPVDSFCDSRASSSRVSRNDVDPPKFSKKRKKVPCETSIVSSGAVGFRSPSQDDNREDIAMFRNMDSSRIPQRRSLSSSSTANTIRDLLEGSLESTAQLEAIPQWDQQESISLYPNKKPYSLKRIQKPSKDYSFGQHQEEDVTTNSNKDSQDAYQRGPIYNPSASTNVAAMALASLMSTNGVACLPFSTAVGREEVENNTTDLDCRDSVHLSSSDELSAPCCHYEEEYNPKQPSREAVCSFSTTSTSVSNTTSLSVGYSSKNVQCYDDTWKIRFNDLVAYKKRYGDCLVPKKSHSHPQLGIWVMNQRAQYKLYLENKPSTMNQERIHALEELGMVWSMCDHVDWQERLEELRQYKMKYGDCLVPNKFLQNPQLGTWVNKQRTQYKRMMEGNQSSMTVERARALERLGFVWSKRDLVDWYSRLEELKQYKKEHGDCLVPNKYSANPQLGTWVMHQRAQYRKLREGKASPMTDERVKALEDVGFCWSTTNADADWNARIKELQIYKDQHGNCLVPNRYPENPRLGTWVGKQRKQYKLFYEGTPCNLTYERVRALDDLGFVWTLRSLVDWDERLEELKEYRKKHGNCLVPQQYPENPQLGTWVSNQRKQYRLLKEGKSSPMTEDRVKKLDEIGFIWSIFSHDTQTARDGLSEEQPEERKPCYSNEDLLERARDVVLLLNLSQTLR